MRKMQKVNVQIGESKVAKLDEIMEKIFDSGVDSINRSETVDHCIDWMHDIIFKNKSNIRVK